MILLYVCMYECINVCMYVYVCLCMRAAHCSWSVQKYTRDWPDLMVAVFSRTCPVTSAHKSCCCVCTLLYLAQPIGPFFCFYQKAQSVLWSLSSDSICILVHLAGKKVLLSFLLSEVDVQSFSLEQPVVASPHCAHWVCAWSRLLVMQLLSSTLTGPQ